MRVADVHVFVRPFEVSNHFYFVSFPILLLLLLLFLSLLLLFSNIETLAVQSLLLEHMLSSSTAGSVLATCLGNLCKSSDPSLKSTDSSGVGAGAGTGGGARSGLPMAGNGTAGSTPQAQGVDVSSGGAGTPIALL